MKVCENAFIPSHLTFKSFEFHSISHNQSNNQSNLSIYYNIPKFRILGCYRLIFDRQRTHHVALLTPTFFDFQAKGRYVITREEANEYERRTETARLHAAAQDAITIVSQYDPYYNFGYPPGQPWP